MMSWHCAVHGKNTPRIKGGGEDSYSARVYLLLSVFTFIFRSDQNTGTGVKTAHLQWTLVGEPFREIDFWYTIFFFSEVLLQFVLVPRMYCNLLYLFLHRPSCCVYK